MSYSQQLIVSRCIAVVLLVMGAIAVGNADTLGVTPRMAAWLAIVAVGLGGAQSFLPNARGTDKAPEHIANRIVELSPTDRAKLAELVQQKHAGRESAA